jgi:CheY-like chemotaxis protein
VLLAEDEDAVRNLAMYLLRHCGYQVLVASSGTEALEVAARHAGPIHLLVTDVVMPKMGGRQLAEALRPTHPGLRVLYLSGYTDDAMLRRGVLEPGAAFLEKPFSIAALGLKVREVLDRAG